jgi:hypothetical protein
LQADLLFLPKGISVGHLKLAYQMERNWLKGVASDAINAVLAATAMNFHKLPGAFVVILSPACWTSGAISLRPGSHRPADEMRNN